LQSGWHSHRKPKFSIRATHLTKPKTAVFQLGHWCALSHWGSNPEAGDTAELGVYRQPQRSESCLVGSQRLAEIRTRACPTLSSELHFHMWVVLITWHLPLVEVHMLQASRVFFGGHGWVSLEILDQICRCKKSDTNSPFATPMNSRFNLTNLLKVFLFFHGCFYLVFMSCFRGMPSLNPNLRRLPVRLWALKRNENEFPGNKIRQRFGLWWSCLSWLQCFDFFKGATETVKGRRGLVNVGMIGVAIYCWYLVNLTFYLRIISR